MKTYKITTEIYEEIVNRAERYNTCFWDCIEVASGHAVVFALDNGRPYDVEVFDEDNNTIGHDFNLSTFGRIANR